MPELTEPRDKLIYNLVKEYNEFENRIVKLKPIEIFDMSRDIEFYKGMKKYLTLYSQFFDKKCIKALIKDEYILNTLYVKYFSNKYENSIKYYNKTIDAFYKTYLKFTGEMC